MGQSSEQVAAHFALKRAQVVMASSDVHGDSGVVTESHATPEVKEKLITDGIISLTL